MPSARISATKLLTYHRGVNGSSWSADFMDIMGGPKKDVEITSAIDCEAKLREFVQDIKRDELPYVVMVSFNQRSGRKPNGFDKAFGRGRYVFVNQHLAPTKE